MELNGNGGMSGGYPADGQQMIRASGHQLSEYGRTSGNSGQPAEPEAGSALWRNVLIALKRKWVPILFLGGMMGASAAFFAWQVIPTPYTAFSELLIKPRNFLFKTKDDETQTGAYKQTMMRMVKDHFVLTAALRSPGLAESETLKNEPYPISWLEKNISVSAPGEQFIRIGLSGEHPEDLAKIVNAVTKSFDEEVILKERADRRTRLEDLKAVMAKENAKLTAKEEALRAIDRQLKLPNSTQSDAKRQATLDAQLEVRRQLGAVRSQLIQLQIELGLTGNEGDEQAQAFAVPEIPAEAIEAELLHDEAYQKMYLEARRHEMMLAEWRKRVGGENRAIREHQEQLDATRADMEAFRQKQMPVIEERIQARAGGQVLTGITRMDKERQLKTLTQMKEAYEDELEKLQIQENTLGMAWVDREELAEEVLELKEEIKQYKDEVYHRQIELDNAPPPIQVRVDAQVPKVPDMGKRQKMAGVAGVGGFGIVAALFVWLELLARRITRTDEVKNQLGLAIIGTIPNVPRSARLNRMKSTGPKSAYWHNVLSEAVDSMRTVLVHRLNAMRAVTILVTGASAGEGKTTLSCQLAASLARTRRRVLLIDGDLRRPSVQYAFANIHPTPGFSEVLAGSAQLADAIQHVESIGLDVLPAGRVTTEVLQRLSHDAHGPVLKELAASYDFIIIDSSPILPVTDALLIAQHVDAVLMSVRRDASRMGKVSSAFHRLRMIGAPVLGAVTIGLDEDSNAYSYGYGYGYGYGSQPGSYPTRPASSNLPAPLQQSQVGD